MKKNRRCFSLLEVMIGIAILAILSSSFFWRLNQMVERKRFDADVSRLRAVLFSSRSLAINSQMDYRLELKETKEGWLARVLCREELDRSYCLPRFSPCKIFFDKKSVKEFTVDFFSTGFVSPKGVLTFSNESQIGELKIPELFYRQEDSSSVPIHPDEVNERL